MTDVSENKPAAKAKSAAPKFIKLLADWGTRLEGSVLRADDDLIGALDGEGVKYREATAQERGLAGLT